MPRAKKTRKKYATFEEYQKAFFPKAKDRPAATEDPARVGTELAKQMLRKRRLVIS